MDVRTSEYQNSETFLCSRYEVCLAIQIEENSVVSCEEKHEVYSKAVELYQISDFHYIVSLCTSSQAIFNLEKHASQIVCTCL